MELSIGYLSCVYVKLRLGYAYEFKQDSNFCVIISGGDHRFILRFQYHLFHRMFSR
jgi:hypothetical protein